MESRGLIEAAFLRGQHNPQVAIVVSAAPPEHHLDHLAAAAGLTSRERQIAACVLAGLSTRQIADQSTISPTTVQAHLTSVFAKTGLRSRRELLNRLRH